MGWVEYEVQIATAMAEQRRVLLSIRSAAAELYALPWELLTLKSTGQCLGELPEVLIRYEYPETKTEPESLLARREGGRILLAWSAAGGRVPAEAHQAAIQKACAAGHYLFDIERDVLPNFSLAGLESALVAAKEKGPPISVVHLLCHGISAGSTFGLVCNGQHDSRLVADAESLRDLFASYSDMVRLVVLSACDSGNAGDLGNHLGSLAQAVQRVGLESIVASRFPLSWAGSICLADVLYDKLLLAPASLEEAFLAGRQSLLRLSRDTPELSDWASLQLYAREQTGHDTRPLVIRPYRGLEAFQPEHQRFFFGRDEEVGEIISELRRLEDASPPQARFYIVAGASGTGKSSIVLAGAVPRLLKERGYALVRMRPSEVGLDQSAEQQLAQVLAQARGLAQEKYAGRVLLVVDQFEEIFTHEADAVRRSNFARTLWAAATDPQSKVSVLLTLRVDFIGRCGELSLDDSTRLDTIAYDPAHHAFISQMSLQQLAEVVARPAEMVGLALEPGLVETILKDVEDEPGALPLIEDALDILWKRRRQRTLTLKEYHDAGRVTGTLVGRAEAIISDLEKTGDDRLARRLLVSLVDANAEGGSLSRRRVAIKDLLGEDVAVARAGDHQPIPGGAVAGAGRQGQRCKRPGGAAGGCARDPDPQVGAPERVGAGGLGAGATLARAATAGPGMGPK